jgi:TolB-like protein/Flp pilus assembly protein TadD
VTPVAPTPQAPARRATLRRIGGAVLVLLAALAALFAWRRPRESPAPAIASLAVLPLANLSGDAAQDYLAEGMTDAIITDLASIRALRVISRQSVIGYKGSAKPLPQIARELGVDGIVEGSVVRSGSRVRVTAQLLHGPSDRHLWANTYERDLGDALRLEAELARAIADEVRASVSPHEQKRLSAARQVPPEAYDAYLKGRFYWNKRDKPGLTKAVEYFERAIALDPQFALAYSGLAEAYGPLGYSAFIPPSEARLRMKAAALKAVELDPGLAEGHTALAACLAFHEWQWAAAEEEFRRALELNPRYGTAHLWYGLYLHSMGRGAEALRESRLALESDPLAVGTHGALALYLEATGDVDGAIDQYSKTLEMDPSLFRVRVSLAAAYSEKGLHEQALAEARRADTDSGGSAFTRAPLGHIAARAGKKDEARRILAELTALSAREYVSPLDLAILHLDLGDAHGAFALLERAYEERAPALSRIKAIRGLAGLHGDPRYKDLLRRMGLDG